MKNRSMEGFRLKTILIILLCSLSALSQTTKDILDRFDYRNYDDPGYSINICPWQSWRLLPYLSMQVDVVVSSEALEMLIADKWILSEALYDMYYGRPKDATELARRFTENGISLRRVKFHVPGLTVPYHLKWELAPRPHIATYVDQNNPQWGWERRILKDWTTMAVKILGNGETQVSIVLFVRPINLY